MFDIRSSWQNPLCEIQTKAPIETRWLKSRSTRSPRSIAQIGGRLLHAGPSRSMNARETVRARDLSLGTMLMPVSRPITRFGALLRLRQSNRSLRKPSKEYLQIDQRSRPFTRHDLMTVSRPTARFDALRFPSAPLLQVQPLAPKIANRMNRVTVSRSLL